MSDTSHLVMSWNSGAVRKLFWRSVVVFVLGARVEQSDANIVTVTLTGPNGPPISTPLSVACCDHAGTIVIGQWGPYGVSGDCTAFDECRVEVNSACQARVQYWERCSSVRSRFPVNVSAWTTTSASSGEGCGCSLRCNIAVSMPPAASSATQCPTTAPSTAPTTVSPTATTSPPSYSPTATPTPQPTATPSSTPTPLPSGSPTAAPTISRSVIRSAAPTTGAPTSNGLPAAPTAVHQSNHSSVSNDVGETDGVDLTLAAAVFAAVNASKRARATK